MGTQEGWERQSTCPKRQKKGQKHLQDFPCYRKTLLLLVQDDPGFHGGEENLNPKSLALPPGTWPHCPARPVSGHRAGGRHGAAAPWGVCATSGG